MAQSSNYENPGASPDTDGEDAVKKESPADDTTREGSETNSTNDLTDLLNQDELDESLYADAEGGATQARQ